MNFKALKYLSGTKSSTIRFYANSDKSECVKTLRANIGSLTISEKTLDELTKAESVEKAIELLNTKVKSLNVEFKLDRSGSGSSRIFKHSI